MSRATTKEIDEKFSQAIEGTAFSKLDQTTQHSLIQLHQKWQFSHQQLRQLITMALDLMQWGGTSFHSMVESVNAHLPDTMENQRKNYFEKIKKHFDVIREDEKDYQRFPCPKPPARQLNIIETSDQHSILGDCPVASTKTRCCNLKTLDAVKNCGFDCSYCSIQSFYYDDKIYVDGNLEQKLKLLKLDPTKRYHIGTGQSSDSLMWGNRSGLLEKLFDFATHHRNVILELKTKSANTAELLQLEIPPNVIITWSLNTLTIIANEEHHTASLEQRLLAAKRVEERGNLIGFHFHPMVIYPDYRNDYRQIAEKIQQDFNPQLVAMISLGTLTFIKPVLKQLRQRLLPSKILQMPFEEIAGKYSYPLAQKEELFSTFFQHFSAEWKQQVFFYLCMEDPSLWEKVFGHHYADNTQFEAAMIESYFQKIDALRKR